MAEGRENGKEWKDKIVGRDVDERKGERARKKGWPGGERRYREKKGHR